MVQKSKAGKAVAPAEPDQQLVVVLIGFGAQIKKPYLPPQLPCCAHLSAGSTTGRCPSLGLVLTPMIAPLGTKRANFGHSDKKVGVCYCLTSAIVLLA